MNHNTARLTLENFVNEWAAPSLRDTMRQDLIALITECGGRVPIKTKPPTCEYCARGIAFFFRGGMLGLWHYDLGDWVRCGNQ